MKKCLSCLMGLFILMTMACNRGTGQMNNEIKAPYELSYAQIHELMKGYTDEWPDIDSDQSKKMPMPPIQKPYAEDAQRIDLVRHEDFTIGNKPLLEVINQRRSRRSYTGEALTLEELSYLLWCTQGIEKVATRQDGSTAYCLRTVPSGGARHPFETYLCINRVEGVPPGVYRYLAVENQLLLVYCDEDLAPKIRDACSGQKFVGEAAVVFVWAAIPYRMEWRYTFMGHKDVMIEAGHVCQNLYLAAESINAGTCAIAAYYQQKIDDLIGVDGKNEFTIYLAPVGKVATE